MLDQEDIQTIFENKYAKLLDLTYEEWLEQGPQTEDQAYKRLQEINEELEQSYDEWRDAEGREREALQDYRDKLKSEYDLLEEVFGLELNDK